MPLRGDNQYAPIEGTVSSDSERPESVDLADPTSDDLPRPQAREIGMSISHKEIGMSISFLTHTHLLDLAIYIMRVLVQSDSELAFQNSADILLNFENKHYFFEADRWRPNNGPRLVGLLVGLPEPIESSYLWS